MKKTILLACMLLVMLMSGCSQEPVKKTVTIQDLDKSKYEIRAEEILNAPYDQHPYSFSIAGVNENGVFGSVLDTGAHPILFQTEFLLTYGEDGAKQYDYPKKNRIIDYVEYENTFYYLTYYFNEEEILYSDLYQYVDGENDIFIETFELNAESLYLAPYMVRYDDGFAIIMCNKNKTNIYQYTDGKLEILYKEEYPEGNIVPSLTQVKYAVHAKENGNEFIRINLENRGIVNLETDLKFARYSIMDDYIVIFDFDNKKEIVYDMEMKELWSSDLETEIVRWTDYADGNTLVYTDNETHDLYIRNYDNDIVYRISAEDEPLLMWTPVSFHVAGHTVYMVNEEKNTRLLSIELLEDIL